MKNNGTHYNRQNLTQYLTHVVSLKYGMKACITVQLHKNKQKNNN